jgi:hypothetical protein
MLGAVPLAMSVPRESITPEKLSYSPSRFVPLQPTGNALHLIGQNSTDWTDFNLSSYVTPQTYAVSLELTVEDTAGGGAQFLVRRKGYTGPDYGPHVRTPNGGLVVNDVIVGCDDMQTIQHKIIAISGTATVRIRITGYWEIIQ